jgi:integrase
MGDRSARQRGQVYVTKTQGYGIRWYDAAGVRQRKAGFETKTAARKWLQKQLDDDLRPEVVTFDQLCEEYLVAHAQLREPGTVTTLGRRLKRPRETFGKLELRQLETRAREIAAWKATLPERSRYGIVSAFRQVLNAGVRWKLMHENPVTLSGPNPQPKRTEIVPFTRGEIDALAIELGRVEGALVVFAAETGLMPMELAPLEHRDVDRKAGVVRVERFCVEGAVKAYGKTDARRRQVPLSARALAAIASVPRRLDTPLIWTAPEGGYLPITGNWARRAWRPALEAAGLGGKRIYDLRHTFASNALAAGISIFELSRFMGTSLAMIDKTYGHLVRDSFESARSRLDAHAEANGPRMGHEAAAGSDPETPQSRS